MGNPLFVYIRLTQTLSILSRRLAKESTILPTELGRAMIANGEPSLGNILCG